MEGPNRRHRMSLRHRRSVRQKQKETDMFTILMRIAFTALFFLLLYIIWAFPVIQGVKWARIKGVSPRWLWLGVLNPGFGWIEYALIRWGIKPKCPSCQQSVARGSTTCPHCHGPSPVSKSTVYENAVIVLACVSIFVITVKVVLEIKGPRPDVVAFESSKTSYLSIISKARQLPAKELGGFVNANFDLFLPSERSSMVSPGRMVVLKVTGGDTGNPESVELSEVFFALASQYRAKGPSEVDTIVLLAHRQGFRQSASGTQGARYREVVTISLIDRSTATLLWTLEVHAPEPSFSLPQFGSGVPSPNRRFVDRNKLAKFLGRLSEGNIRPAGTFSPSE